MTCGWQNVQEPIRDIFSSRFHVIRESDSSADRQSADKLWSSLGAPSLLHLAYSRQQHPLEIVGGTDVLFQVCRSKLLYHGYLG